MPNTELFDELVLPKTAEVLFVLLPELNTLNCDGCALVLFAELAAPKIDELPPVVVLLPKFELVLDWKLKPLVLPF